MRQPPERDGSHRAPRGPLSLSAPPVDAARERDQDTRPTGRRSSLVGSALDSVAFLRGFLQHPDQVGSVIPSSPALERHLVRAAGLEQARCVVELGPGTGGTTRAFLRAMKPQARLLAIELSPMFHARIRTTIRDGRLLAQLGSAEQIADHLAAWRLPPPDAVISGIPFSTMPTDVADRIAAAIAAALAPGGRFIAYQVRAHVADYASRYLGPPAKTWQWLNIPPVRVFSWTRPHA